MLGCWVFNREFVKIIPFISKGFEVETQLIIQELYYQFHIEEVEITLGKRPEGSLSKLNTLWDGFRVILSIFNILKAYRPLLFFGCFALAFMLMGFGLGFIPILEYFQTGLVSRFPTAILASALVLVSLILLAIGMILDTINFRMKELMQNFLKQ